MTLSAPAAPRKPRRLGLYAPYAVLGVLIVVWSGVWLWMMQQTTSRLDNAAAELRGDGWTVSWSSRHVGGYPFRLDVDFTGLSVADPSGWALATPMLKSEAYLFAPDRWIMATPDGLTFSRPDGGPVNVTARVLKASINSWDQHPPRFSLEGDNMSFAAAPGAKPFSLASAGLLQFYTVAGPQDQGAVFFSIDGGKALPGSTLARIAQGGALTAKVNLILSHVSALHGHDWRGLMLNWAHGGGALDVRQITLTAGDAALDARSGDAAVSDTGQWVGVMPSSVRQAPRIMAAMAVPPGPPPAETPQSALAVALPLTFKDGKTLLGPVRLAPAPRAF